jgi:BON domain
MQGGHPVTVRTFLSLAAAVCLGLAATNTTNAQSRSKPASPSKVNVHQELANNVAALLGKSSVSDGAKVSVTAANGVVTITGEVLSQRQAQSLVDLAYTYPGVAKVETSFRMSSPYASVKPAQNVKPVQAKETIAPPMAFPGINTTDPLPLVQPAVPAYDMTGPRMPPYAWPTYAPYPNMSRVAYPESYPYNAFPFIGPYYPFPKVPPGWRSVKLEWEDGHWYLGRLSTPHDYWRIKFW